MWLLLLPLGLFMPQLLRASKLPLALTVVSVLRCSPEVSVGALPVHASPLVLTPLTLGIATLVVAVAAGIAMVMLLWLLCPCTCTWTLKAFNNAALHRRTQISLITARETRRPPAPSA